MRYFNLCRSSASNQGPSASRRATSRDNRENPRTKIGWKNPLKTNSCGKSIASLSDSKANSTSARSKWNYTALGAHTVAKQTSKTKHAVKESGPERPTTPGSAFSKTMLATHSWPSTKVTVRSSTRNTRMVLVSGSQTLACRKHHKHGMAAEWNTTPESKKFIWNKAKKASHSQI